MRWEWIFCRLKALIMRLCVCITTCITQFIRYERQNMVGGTYINTNIQYSDEARDEGKPIGNRKFQGKKIYYYTECLENNILGMIFGSMWCGDSIREHVPAKTSNKIKTKQCVNGSICVVYCGRNRRQICHRQSLFESHARTNAMNQVEISKINLRQRPSTIQN